MRRFLHPQLATTVRWQIVLPFAGLVLLTSALGAFVLTGVLRGSLEGRFLGHLVEASRVASEALVRRERVHLELSRAISHTAGVAEALRTGSAGLDGLVFPQVANASAEWVEVIDATGVSRYVVQRGSGADRTYRDAAPLAAPLPGLERVLRGERDALGDKFIDVVERDGESWLVTSAPIAFEGELYGAVLIGTRIDSALASAREESLADITAFAADGRMLGSTSLARLEAPGAAPELAAGATVALELGTRSYRELHSELLLRGQAVGYLGTALPSDFLAESVGAAQWRVSALLFVALVLTMWIGSRVAHRLTVALADLVATSRQVTSGDLTARARPTRRDEIGELGRTFDRMTETLQEQHLGAIASLVSAIDARDPYTRGHSLRVGHLAARLGAQIGLSEEHQHYVRVGGYLHDIGKIGIRDDVLLKPGRLTPEERDIIEQHPTIGHEILASVGLAPDVLAGVVFHHERLDGSGYPLGLQGDDVPLPARLIMVADVYDALVTDRPYRGGMPPFEALWIIRDEVDAGRLDPAVVEALGEVWPAWEEVWRGDERLTGLSLDHATLDPAMFTRATA